MNFRRLLTPCVLNGSDPHTIRDGGCSVRPTTQSEKEPRPAKAKDIRRALASPVSPVALIARKAS